MGSGLRRTLKKSQSYVQDGSEMRKDMFLYLRPHDNAALVTIDGELKQALTHDEKELLRNADAVQGMMIDIMKYPEARTGMWVWKITEKWGTLAGWELGTPQDRSNDVYDM